MDEENLVRRPSANFRSFRSVSTGSRSSKYISTASRASTPTSFHSKSSTFLSKTKMDQFSPTSRKIMKNAYVFLRVKLATVDAFPMDRIVFVKDGLETYSHLSSTSPDFKQHILMAGEEDKDVYIAYVSF